MTSCQLYRVVVAVTLPLSIGLVAVRVGGRGEERHA
jgi:hypothetical protein